MNDDSRSWLKIIWKFWCYQIVILVVQRPTSNTLEIFFESTILRLLRTRVAGSRLRKSLRTGQEKRIGHNFMAGQGTKVSAVSAEMERSVL